MKLYKDILLSKYDSFEASVDPFEKSILKKEIEHILIENKIDLDAKDYFIWGAVCYLSNENKKWNLRKAIEKFLQSLAIDLNHVLSRLYLGHCYQDKGIFEKALKHYSLVNQEILKAEFPIWRLVKLKEQMGYCYYKLGNPHKGIVFFKEAMRYYNIYGSAELAHPTEVLACLPPNHPLALRVKAVMC